MQVEEHLEDQVLDRIQVDSAALVAHQDQDLMQVELAG